MDIKDKLWLWGHGREFENREPGDTALYGRPGIGKLTTAEAAEYMGIKNICRVAIETTEIPPFDKEAEQCLAMESVVWSALGCGRIDARDDTDEVLRLADKYDNIKGAVLDDFFPTGNPIKAQKYTPMVLRKLAHRLHTEAENPLKLWIVVYSGDLDFEGLAEYLKECDVVTLWVWDARNLYNLDEYYDKLRLIVGPEKPIVTGCYMWDYTARTEMAPELMEYQLKKYEEWLRAGKTDGIIFCHNYIVDLGLKAVEYVKEWIKNLN